VSTIAELTPMALVRRIVKGDGLRRGIKVHEWFFLMPDGSERKPDAFLASRVGPKLELIDGDTKEFIGKLEDRPALMKKVLGMRPS
jgi:hypothetical protein